jgi:hypothetical protein
MRVYLLMDSECEADSVSHGNSQNLVEL